MNNILIPFFEVNGTDSYPLGVVNIGEVIEFNGSNYFLGLGDLSAETGADTYGDYEKTLIDPILVLDDFTVKSNGVDMAKAGNIYWTGLGEPFEITSSVTDEAGVIASLNTSLGKPEGDSTNFIVMLERVVKQEDGTITVVGDLRVAASVTATEMTINSTKGFSVSGNYVVTAERLNKGLDEIGAPFRIEMETLEFDVLNG